MPRSIETANWNDADAPQIGKFAAGARASWDSAPNATPKDVVQPVRLGNFFGTTITTKDFQDLRLRVALEQHFVEALLWGLVNPDRFTAWYNDQLRRYESSLNSMRSSGLSVDALPSLSGFFDQSEQIIRNYERDIAPLPDVPAKLLNDARSLGVRID